MDAMLRVLKGERHVRGVVGKTEGERVTDALLHSRAGNIYNMIG